MAHEEDAKIVGDLLIGLGYEQLRVKVRPQYVGPPRKPRPEHLAYEVADTLGRQERLCRVSTAVGLVDVIRCDYRGV